MECTEKNLCRSQLSKNIADKIELIAKLRSELENGRKTISNSVDDQLLVAEMEYRLVKEEMALINLQEQHWESAAKWDIPPHTPDIQKELCEVLHSYILSVREKGAIPALHASEHSAPENSILISSQGGKPSIPKVEWAHHSTELQIGDRLLEVNGHLLLGKEASEVGRILSRPLRRVVYLRPLSPQHMLKGGLRETSNLRQELTAVVSRLNREMGEKERLATLNKRILTESNDLKTQNGKLKLQVLSLQSILIYLYQALEKNNYPINHSLLQTENSSTAFDMLRNIAMDEHCSVLCSGALKDMLSTQKKSIPWLELTPRADDSKALDHEKADTG